MAVNGRFSDEMALRNMVFQGTVWGPPLGNVFFEDARVPVNKAGYTEAGFADDLNAYKQYEQAEENEELALQVYVS